MFQGTGGKVCVLIKGFNPAIKKHGRNLFSQSSAWKGSFLTREQRVLTYLAPCSRPGEEEKRSRTQAHLLSVNTSGGGVAHQEAEEPGQT